MKVFEVAKQTGMTNAEIKEKTGLTSHLSIVPEEILVDLIHIETKDSSEIVVIEAKPEKDELPEGVTPAMVWHACTGVGTRHPLWKFKHLGIKPVK